MSEKTTMGREWSGTPLDMRDRMDPHGIKEIVVEYDGGESDTFTSKERKEFHAYELHQMAAYFSAIQAAIRKEQRRRGRG